MGPRHTDFLTTVFDAVCTAAQVTPKCCSLDQSLPPGPRGVLNLLVTAAYEVLVKGLWLSFMKEETQ